MTRVLFVEGAAERGGAQRVLLALARHLPAYGIDPCIAFVGVDGPFVDEVRAAGIDTVAVDASARVREPWKAPAVVRGIAAAAAATGADLLHANGEKMAVFARRAARRAAVPCVAWLHDEPRRSFESTAVELAMLAGPPAVNVAASRWLSSQFTHRLRCTPRVVPMGIDLDALPPAGDTAVGAVRDAAGWPAAVTVIAHFGRLQEWKGADVFLRAAASVAERHDDARFLVVVGALYGWDTEYADRLPVLARDLGLGDRVHFTGHRDDALALMAGCDVVVHSSRRGEPFGLVVVEAMALGRAVVASRTGGPEEILTDGRTGLLTPPGDTAALAAALDRLLFDPSLRTRLAAAAESDARARFSAVAMAGRFAALYDDVLAGHPAPSRSGGGR